MSVLNNQVWFIKILGLVNVLQKTICLKQFNRLLHYSVDIMSTIMDQPIHLALTFIECTEREENLPGYELQCWLRGIMWHILGLCVAKALCTSGKETGKQNTHKKQNAIERQKTALSACAQQNITLL